MWLEEYPLAYDGHARAAREARARLEARRRSRPATFSKPLTPDQAVWRDWRAERARSRAAVIEDRWKIGEVWHGGYAGGDRRCWVAPYAYPGLRSSEHPILRRFVEALPQAKNGLLTGRNKAFVSAGDSKLLMLDEEYAVANSEMRCMLRVDLDRDFPGGAAEVEMACALLHLPRPNLVVGHQSGDVLRHPHLIWLIDKAVCFTSAGLPQHKALWWRVLRGLTWALQEIGADPGGLSNPMRVKNPLCGCWTGTAVLEEAPWSLAEMKRGLRLDVSDDDFAAARDLCLTKFDGDTPAAPGVSNGFFVALSNWARETAQARRRQGVSEPEWLAEVAQRALEMAEAQGIAESRARATARRVADHAWGRTAAPRLAPVDVTRLRMEAGRTSSAIVADRHRLAVIAAVLALADGDAPPTKAAVQRRTGYTAPTVRRWWPDALAALAARGEKPVLSDKKEDVHASHGTATADRGAGRERPRPPTFLLGGSIFRPSAIGCVRQTMPTAPSTTMARAPKPTASRTPHSRSPRPVTVGIHPGFIPNITRRHPHMPPVHSSGFAAALRPRSVVAPAAEAVASAESQDKAQAFVDRPIRPAIPSFFLDTARAKMEKRIDMQLADPTLPADVRSRLEAWKARRMASMPSRT